MGFQKQIYWKKLDIVKIPAFQKYINFQKKKLNGNAHNMSENKYSIINKFKQQLANFFIFVF